VLLLHVSDTHLGATRPGKLREREMDFYEAFNEVVDIAIRERVDAVIHAGDFFDEPRPTPQAYLFAYRALRRLREHGVELLVVAGQHDQPKTSQLPPLRVLGEMGLLRLLAQEKPETHTIRLRSGELGVTAIPYISPAVIGEHLKTTRPPDSARRVLLGHLLLKELNIPSAHASLAELGADKYSYVALGDYHLKYETRYAGVPVVYPGSTEALSVLEVSEERYVALVDLSGGEAAISWVKLSAPRKWIVLEVRGFTDLLIEVGRARLEKYAKPPILHVVLKTRLSELEARRVREYINKLVSERRVLLGRVEVEESEEPGVARRILEEVTGREEPPTLDHVVYSVLGDVELAELVLAILKSCESEEEVRLLVNKLVESERLLEKVKRLVSAK
jgi:DNA repair exonuclease SbcCD nuclease subunit